jgi:type III secretion protein C
MGKRFVWLLAVWLGVAAPGIALAEEATGDNPQWFTQPYAYLLVEQDVRAALEEFGRNLGLIVVMSDKVHGKARSSVRGRSAGDFLAQLCETNGLSWYYDGNILYLNSDAEIGTRLFKSQELQSEQLEAWLNSLDVYGKQLSSRFGPDGDELFVSGPPAYLNMVAQHVDQQRRPVAAPVMRERGVRVFRGSSVTEVSN